MTQINLQEDLGELDYFILFGDRSHYLAQAGFKLNVIPLPQPSKC